MDARDWDERYSRAAASESTVWSERPNAFIAETVGAFEPGTSIDLACGEGRNALWLAERGWQVTAVDFSSAGMDTGRDRALQLGLEIQWVVADVTEWISPVLVDLVVIAYLQLEREWMDEVIRAASGFLEPGGRIVLIGHDADNLTRGIGGPQDESVLLTVDGLRTAAEGLEIERCEQVEREVGDALAIDAVLVARR